MQLAADQRGLHELGQDCKVLRLLQSCLKPKARLRCSKANSRDKNNFSGQYQQEAASTGENSGLTLATW